MRLTGGGWWRSREGAARFPIKIRHSLLYSSFSSTFQFGLIRRTTLGVLTSSARKPEVMGTLAVVPHRSCRRCAASNAAVSIAIVVSTDKWSPHEVALFESAICLFGKMFSQLQKVVSKEIRGGGGG